MKIIQKKNHGSAKNMMQALNLRHRRHSNLPSVLVTLLAGAVEPLLAEETENQLLLWEVPPVSTSHTGVGQTCKTEKMLCS